MAYSSQSLQRIAAPIKVINSMCAGLDQRLFVGVQYSVFRLDWYQVM